VLLSPNVLFWNRWRKPTKVIGYNPLSGTTRVSRYQKKHSPILIIIQSSNISFFHLPRSIASSLFKCAWHNLSTSSGLRLGLEPSTSYFIRGINTRLSSSNQCLLFCNTCPNHRNLFCCSIKIISSMPSIALNCLLGIFYLDITHPSDHSHLCSLSDRPGLASVYHRFTWKT